jgi:hypothetical protein
VTLLLRTADGQSSPAVVSPEFTFGDVLTACARAAGVWQEELFGISRRAQDGTDIWLTTDPQLVVGDGPDGINYLLDTPLALHVKYWKQVTFAVDNRAAELVAAEAAARIADGVWPCSEASALRLASLRVRLELGAYDARRHTPGTLTPKHLKRW